MEEEIHQPLFSLLKLLPKKPSNPPKHASRLSHLMLMHDPVSPHDDRKATMKKSPVHPKHEMDHHDGVGFDPQADFYQFLEEAKHYAVGGDFHTSSAYAEEGGERRLSQEKKKKSWKKLLFPWLKGEKTSKTSVKPATISHVSKTRRTNVSGPVYGTGKAADGKPRRPTSGPISSLFNPTKKSDDAIPYMCLDKNGSPQVVQTYGPVYVVT